MLEFVVFLFIIVFCLVALSLSCYILSHYEKDFLLSKLIDLKLKLCKLSVNSIRYKNILKKVNDIEYKLNLYDCYKESKNEKENN